MRTGVKNQGVISTKLTFSYYLETIPEEQVNLCEIKGFGESLEIFENSTRFLAQRFR